jgi:hypothetical membrane protein
MTSARNRLSRIAGVCGIVTPIVALTLVFVSVAMSPWFSWHDNALSDMGVSATPNPFNAGLIAGGALYLVFAIGLTQILKFSRTPGGRLARLGKLAIVLGAVALPLIGIFTENFGRLHYYVAATYFLATPVGYVLLGSVMTRSGNAVNGLLTIAAGLAAILAITLVPHKRIAVPEILASVIMSSWTLAMGVKMLLGQVPHE